MYRIYIIRNNINSKVYIGKTSKTLEQRFRVHKLDSLKEKTSHRKLYKAMNTLGHSNFKIELLAFSSNEEIANNLEKFYIQKFNSFKDGYNETLGGNGKNIIPKSTFNKILDYINSHKYYYLSDISKQFNVDKGTVKSFLKSKNIKINRPPNKIHLMKYKRIECYTKDLIFVDEFEYYEDIKKFLNNYTDVSRHIKDVCCGKRKSAYGYIWVGFD